MRLWKQLRRSWKSARSTSRTPRQKRNQLRIEALEARDVPTAVFTPHFGTETVSYHGGDLLNDPDVHLIFWGPEWQTTFSQLASDIQTSASSLLSSAYFTGLAQYSVSGHPISGHAQLGKVVFDTSTVPNGFTQNQLEDRINRQVDIGALPESDATSQEPIYVVLTPPGVTAQTLPGEPPFAGFHSHFTRFDFPFDFDGMNFAWVSGGSAGTLDGYTRLFSHEIAETIVDPDPNSGWTSNQPGFPNSAGNTEISDWEAEGRFGYVFRVNGVLAQSYFSPADQAFIVPDGNQQKFFLTRNFVGTTATDTFTLSLTGDQRPGTFNDNLLLFTTNNESVSFFQNGETATFDPFTITSINVNMGTGTDGIDVVSTATNVPVFLTQGSNANTTVDLFPSGSGLFTGKIRSDIFWNGPVSGTGTESFSSSTINVNDTLNNSTLPQNWTLTDNTLRGTPLGFLAIHYTTLGNLNITTNGSPNNFVVTGLDGVANTTINTASSNDVFAVEKTQLNTTLTINSGSGANTVDIGRASGKLDAILGPVTVHGGGSDTLHLFDQNSVLPSGYTLDASTVGTQTASVSYAGIRNLILDGAAGVTNLNRDYAIRGLGATGGTTVNAKGLINHFNIGSPTGTLVGFAPSFNLTTFSSTGRLNINGANSIDTIVVNDSQSTVTGTSYTINGTNLVRSAHNPFPIIGSNTVTIAYTTGFGSSVELDTAIGGSTIRDNGTSVQTSVVGGSGADTLVGPNLVNSWLVTGLNQGTLPGLTFRNIENLIGNNQNDTFLFADGARVTGRIDGGGGNNTLNYFRYTTDVTANLTLGRATGASAIAHINNVTGGSGNDVLVGNALDNILIGGAGRNILIGGLGSDTLNAPTGGLGQDILIGGRTSFDANAAALNLIKAEWVRPDTLFSTYRTRVSHLLNGGGLNGTVVLSPATVFADGARDLVSSSSLAVLDLLFIDSLDVLSQPAKSGEVVIQQ